MGNTTDIIGNTFRIKIFVNITTYSNVDAEIFVNVYSGSECVLKYKKGGGTGFDGDVELDGSHTFYITLTPDDAKKIKQGRLYVEGKLIFPDDNFPSGRVVPFRVEIRESITKYNTQIG